MVCNVVLHRRGFQGSDRAIGKRPRLENRPPKIRQHERQHRKEHRERGEWPGQPAATT
jgi:hypothetical protein